MHLGFVDVRDVASAHLLAMTNDAAVGERFIISDQFCSARSRQRCESPGSKALQGAAHLAGEGAGFFMGSLSKSGDGEENSHRQIRRKRSGWAPRMSP